MKKRRVKRVNNCAIIVSSLKMFCLTGLHLLQRKDRFKMMTWFGKNSRRKAKRPLLPTGSTLHRSEAGQSLVEFALVLPVLLLILLGIIQFGAVFNSLITLNAAAREGARLMAAESCLE
jgi:hypothetical protein